MSWLAAARKRVLEILASSASALARPSSALSRVSSSVRSRTRTLQRLVGALQRLGRLHARRDVGEGGDDAAVRHAVGAHLDRPGRARRSARGTARCRRRSRASRSRTSVVDRAGAERALLGVEAQDLVERDADARQLRRQIEDFAELPVPADQPQVLVEHRDALAHVVERGLQDFAVVVDRRVGVVEQLERGLGRDRALAQQQRQHEPRRRGADRRGEQVLGVAQQLEVGLRLRLEADAPRSRRSFRTTSAVRSSPR